MLNTTPEYLSAYQRDLGAGSPTANGTEVRTHRRKLRRQKVVRFIAALSRTASFKKVKTEDRYLTQHH